MSSRWMPRSKWSLSLRQGRKSASPYVIQTIVPRRRNVIYSLSRSAKSRREMIRNATIHDVPRIGDIINSHAELGKMLFKSYAQLFESIRDFAVCVDDATGEIVGCAAL